MRHTAATGLEKAYIKKRFLGFRFLNFFKVFGVFLYKDRTRKYDPQAHEKHPISLHVTPYLTKDKSPVSEGEEHRAKNDDEIDESHKSHY